MSDPHDSNLRRAADLCRDLGRDALAEAVSRAIDRIAELTRERDQYHDALIARHGGEPVALLAELDEARARIAELEAAEVILREMAKLYAGQIDNTGNYCNQLHDSARAHFARYAKD